jgi:hypothetical protein
MVPKELQALFWDTNLRDFEPAGHPDYTIFRVLEYGDTDSVQWLRKLFSEDEIRRVLRSERRLTPKSATFWALVYGIPAAEISALQAANSPFVKEV